MSLMGKVKEVYDIPNLYIILSKEGFQTDKLTYLGGLWVLIELDSLDAIEKFCLLIRAWTTNTFSKVASKWGDLVVWEESEENSLTYAWVPKFLNKDHSSDDESSESEKGCKFEDQEHTNQNDDDDVDKVSESSCMKRNDFVQETTLNVPNEESPQSKDPFNIYELLQKKNVKSIPTKNRFTRHNGDTSSQRSTSMLISEGSILEVMDDLVKVGQTMRLCTQHKINFVALKATKMESIDLFSIKAVWGNYSFDHAMSSSIGNSGDILYIWDPNMFIKDYVSFSDYFLAIMGTWAPSSTKLLIISVYAPQELSEKG
ncbi:hypothetical protein Tco_0194531 [Tanacetum coccineum]